MLLRRTDHPVDELAQALRLTHNAIRAHLATLERDGLVRQSGERRSGGKPASVYTLTPQAEQLFPQSYDLVLSYLLDALAEKVTVQERETLMRTVGEGSPRNGTSWMGMESSAWNERSRRSINSVAWQNLNKERKFRRWKAIAIPLPLLSRTIRRSASSQKPSWLNRWA